MKNQSNIPFDWKNGQLELNKLHFGVALKSLPGKEFNLAASTFAGVMHINYIYTAPNLAYDIASQIADDAIGIIEENIV